MDRNKYMYNAPTVRSIKRPGTYKNSARNTAFPMPLQFTNMDGKNVCERNDVMLTINNCFNLPPQAINKHLAIIYLEHICKHRPLVPMTYDIRCRSCRHFFFCENVDPLIGPSHHLSTTTHACK